jgi:putative pyruvate formate lyase activating enzyme
MDIASKIKKIDKALEVLSEHRHSCRLCPRQCSVDREKESGYCSTGKDASLSHTGLHFGEEPVLSGYEDCKEELKKGPGPQSGSGTIFFTGCHLKCLYCQNYQISWENQGSKISTTGLARKMLEIQRKGALNINLVSPTHMIRPILSALKKAYEKGLSIPLVYNSCGYERDVILKNLEGIIDVYLPDIKYLSSQLSKQLSGVSDYFDYAKRAILEMSRQQPELILDRNKTVQQGLIIRHLVLPGQINDSKNILNWIKKNISNSFGLSLMSQFYPCFRTPLEFRRKISSYEYEQVLETAQKLAFKQMYIQPALFPDDRHLIPDFKQKNPFGWE